MCGMDSVTVDNVARFINWRNGVDYAGFLTIVCISTTGFSNRETFVSSVASLLLGLSTPTDELLLTD